VPTLTLEAVCPKRVPGENLVGRWVSSLFPHHEPSPLASAVNPYSLYKRTSMAKPHGRQREKGARERPLAEWDSSSLSDISCILGRRCAARLHTRERGKMYNKSGSGTRHQRYFPFNEGPRWATGSRSWLSVSTAFPSSPQKCKDPCDIAATWGQRNGHRETIAGDAP
jgi:hypothetical protein